MKNKGEQTKNFAKRKNHFVRNSLIVSGILIFIALISVLGIFLVKNTNKNKITIKTIKQSWEQTDYKGVYEQGKIFLQDKPYNNTVLTYYGYACFYLAISQIDTYQTQEYPFKFP